MRTVVWVVAGMILGLAGVCARAAEVAGGNGGNEGGGEAALPGSRVLRTFDFEEAKLGNFEATPMYWSKVVGRGYPAYSVGTLDHTVFRSSDTSFKLQTDGGSVAYRFTPPAEKRIQIHPNADYYVLAFVKSSGLKYARAEVEAWFADEDGSLIMSTETHSQAYQVRDSADGDAWQVLYVYMPGPVAAADGTVKAKSLVLQMGLMQPQQAARGGMEGADDGLGKFAIYQQDIKGAVWLDDMTVFQMPRLGVSARKDPKSMTPAGMFGAGEQVKLDVELSDLTKSSPTGPVETGGLKSRVRITDADGLVYAQQEWDANPSPNRGWSQLFEHAPLPAGMYTATLEVIDQGVKGGGLIARRQTQFLCLPENVRTSTPDPIFGLGATSFGDTARWGELPLLLRQTGAGTLQLPAWRHDMPEESLTRRDVALEALMAALQRQNVRMIGVFPELPGFVSSKLSPAAGEDRSSILSLLSAEPGLWRPYMSFLLTRYANRIDWWELGAPDAPFSGTLSGTPQNTSTDVAGTLADKSAKLYQKTYGEVGGMLTRQAMVIPWNALFDFDVKQYPHAILDLRLPAVIKPSQIPAYLDSFRPENGAAGEGALNGRAKRVPIFAHLEGLGVRDTARSDRLGDFAQRVVYAFASAPESILYDVVENKPDELMLVYSTMIRALGGSTSLGELPLNASDASGTESGSGGLHAFLFKKVTGGATLVMWTQTAGKELQMDLPLGAAPRMTDLLGNEHALKIDAATHLTHVKVSTTPTVIENVEPQVLLLTSSFAISTPNLPAGAGSVRTQVMLKNPYNESLTGTLRMVPPKGWTVDPPSMQVTLAAGGSLRQEVVLRYPFTENAGRKQLGARLSLDSGNPTGHAHLDLSFPVSVSSDQVEMEGFVRFDGNGDILVQQVISNTAGVALDAQAYVLVPGFPRQERYIVGLLPGQTTIKRFTFSAKDYVEAGATAAMVARKLSGGSTTLGVRQSDGRTLLTKSVPLE